MDKLNSQQLLEEYKVAFGGLMIRDDTISDDTKQRRLRAAHTELLRRLNQSDLEQFTGMLTRLGAEFTNNPADAEDIEMVQDKWPTLHTTVKVYPIEDTWPLGYRYCWSEWYFDKDGKLIAQGASE